MADADAAAAPPPPPADLPAGTSSNRPPNLLSNEMEKLLSCISEKTTHCVFNIEVEKAVVKKGKRRKGSSSTVTGFAISQVGTRITILTCAHGFDEAYSAKKDATIDSLKGKFVFKVICTHQKERNRKVARVLAVDCRKDLLLLEFDSFCTEPHRPLSMGNTPHAQDLVVLQGWPPSRPETVAFGRMTCFRRSYADLTADNHKGYNMFLTELTDLCCANGCSGGPLIDGKVNYVGVYHGTQRNSGYAVSFGDMKSFVDTYFNVEG